MPLPALIEPRFPPEALSFELEERPHPDSLDSGEECSLAHLMRVLNAVESEDRELNKYVFDDSCLRVA